MSELAERPLRADARRNRARVLAAARAVFAEQGRDAQVDDVARRADVGVGTVYRHFPTKEALLSALKEEMFEVVAAHVRTLVDRENAWEAFREAIWFCGEKTAGDRAFTEIMAARRALQPQPPAGEADLQVTLGELMRRAKAEGRMRPDVELADIPMLMCGVGSASGMPHPSPQAWRRHLAIVLDGMRAEAGDEPLPA